MVIRDDFLDFIKRVENGAKIGYDPETSMWKPHASPEGGNDTIGYGHKLADDETWMQSGVSDANIEDLLLNDLWRAEDGANTVVDNFNKLDQYKQEMLVDFVYNLGAHGLRRFPKFRKAIADDDIATMRQEYKRYYTDSNGVKKELEHRNREFYDMFLV
tara:strand:- start:2348 stop:2824 length:477 start_codon:yes stop_codon:yes gene_type:complete